MAQTNAPFNVVETTIDDIHGAYKSGQLSCRQLVQIYLDRIEAFDKKGPRINAIILRRLGTDKVPGSQDPLWAGEEHSR